MIKNSIKIKDLKLRIIFLFICLLGYLFITQTTYASPLSLSLDPPIIEINAIPPAIVTADLTVGNTSDSQIILQIQLKPFRALGENGELEYLKESLLLKNVAIIDNGIPVESITLGPSQEKKLTLKLDLSENINISDYYFSIIFISKNILSPALTSSLNQLGITTNVLLSVGSPEPPDAILEEFSTKPFYEKGPVPFTIRVKNKGTHFIKPKGEIIIKNMFGQSIGKLELYPVNILSGSIRAIPNNLYMQDLTSDFMRPIALWRENFLFGSYTATLNISLFNDEPSFTRSIHFFAFPFQTLIILVITVMIGIIIRNRLKTYMKK